MRACSPPRKRYSGRLASAAAALAAASEQPRIAFAPRRLFVGVPSSSTSAWSRERWSAGSTPTSASAISPSTFETARRTPFPRYAPGSPSRSSTASCSPVEAPEGTVARPNAPDARRTSTSTVGLPRESRTWRPWTDAIVLIRSLPSPARNTHPATRDRASASRLLLQTPARRPSRPVARTAESSTGARAPDRRRAVARRSPP